MEKEYFLGISGIKVDPAVAIVCNGKLVAHIEEERLARNKHARGIYPLQSLKFCLKKAGINFSDVTAIGVNWDLMSYTNGTIKLFFDRMDQQWQLDSGTKAWQTNVLNWYNIENYRNFHEYNWRREFGKVKFPPFHIMEHHYVHALHAFFQSPYKKALCITIDGSGETDCTVLWDCEENIITPLLHIKMPHSLGWYYAAFTEYLGFDAYDGEYKVMGLAAYGDLDQELVSKVNQVLHLPNETPPVYYIDPQYIHYGKHSWSGRYTDNLVALLGKNPRRPSASITQWHKNLAYAVQFLLDEAVRRLADWGLKKTRNENLCIGGGVGLNIKMNSSLFKLNQVKSIFVQPLCSDSGAAAGAALAACWGLSGSRPEQLKSLALGNDFSDKEIEEIFVNCKISFSKHDDITQVIAERLAQGEIIGWFQGRMEAGPRALGYRSILASPQKINIRDRINKIVKYREHWRPFCPAIIAEDAHCFFDNFDNAPFMNISFDANHRMQKLAPAVVHVDGTARVQIVHKYENPLFHKLICAYKEKTGLPILLNTSFNIKGEPIVCTVNDAIRTFFGSGLDALACGSYLLTKRVLKGTNN